MFFVNCVFKNDMFFIITLIYDVMKVIVITCFFINCVFENDIILLFLRVRNNYDDMFFANCVFENDILCMFYYIIFINPTIKII